MLRSMLMADVDRSRSSSTVASSRFYPVAVTVRQRRIESERLFVRVLQEGVEIEVFQNVSGVKSAEGKIYIGRVD